MFRLLQVYKCKTGFNDSTFTHPMEIEVHEGDEVILVERFQNTAHVWKALVKLVDTEEMVAVKVYESEMVDPEAQEEVAPASPAPTSVDDWSWGGALATTATTTNLSELEARYNEAVSSVLNEFAINMTTIPQPARSIMPPTRIYTEEDRIDSIGWEVNPFDACVSREADE